jgi:DNA-binding response OmpR family regulator
MEVEPINILLVEDNPADVYLVEKYLKEVSAAQFALTHVERFGRALQYLEEEWFDVVLLDLSLPDAHGADMVAQMREVAPDTPIVVLTGRDDEELAVQTLREGAQDYFLKINMRSEALARVVRYAIERNRLQVEMLRLQKEFRQAEQAWISAEIADAAVHEINSPLTLVQGITERLLQELIPGDPQRRDLEAIREAAQRIVEIVRKTQSAQRYYLEQ